MQQTQLVNLTPHPINIVQDGSVVLSIPSSGVARVASSTDVVGQFLVGDVVVPRTHTVYGEVEGLPAPQAGVIYVVSGMIVSALVQQGIRRDDLFIPGMQVRDEQGRVIGCQSVDN